MATTFWVKAGGSWSENPGGAGNDPSSAGTSHDDIEAAINTGGAGAGDTIKVSDAHNKSHTADQTYVGPSLGSDALVVISVGDAASGTYSPGAKESSSAGAYDIIPQGVINFYGVDFTVGDDFLPGDDATIKVYDCTLETSGAGDAINCAQYDNVSVELYGVDIKFGSTSGKIVLQKHCRFIWIGGSVDSAGSSPTNIFDIVGSGGSYARIYGVDLSHCGTALMPALSATLDDTIDIVFSHCEFPASWTIPTAQHRGQEIKAYACTDSSGKTYEFYENRVTGTIEHETTIKRNESQNLPDGSTKLTMKVTTNSECWHENPLWFDLPVQYGDLSAAATDHLRVFFCIDDADTLDTTEVWATLMYSDGTNEYQANFVTSHPSISGRWSPNPRATGSTHTDDSGNSDWRNGGSALTGYNEYRLGLDTTGDPAKSTPFCAPFLRIFVGIASKTIYFDSTVEYAATA